MRSVGYGIDLSEAETLDTLGFLKQFPEDYNNYLQCLKSGNYKENERTCRDWFVIYEGAICNDITGFFIDKINKTEGLSLSGEDCGKVYISYQMPWDYTEKERTLTESEFCNILAKWVNKITNDVLTIDFMAIDMGD